VARDRIISSANYLGQAIGGGGGAMGGAGKVTEWGWGSVEMNSRGGPATAAAVEVTVKHITVKLPLNYR